MGLETRDKLCLRGRNRPNSPCLRVPFSRPLTISMCLRFVLSRCMQGRKGQLSLSPGHEGETEQMLWGKESSALFPLRSSIEENTMTKPLDGLAFQAYCRHLGLSREAQELLATIRSSPPNRNPRGNHGNMPVWYPSKKMQCVIKAESHTVEFAFLLLAEYGDDVLEYYDQPYPPIQLEYLDKRGHRQT